MLHQPRIELGSSAGSALWDEVEGTRATITPLKPVSINRIIYS